MSFDEQIYHVFLQAGRPLTTREVCEVFYDVDYFAVMSTIADLLRTDILRWLYPVSYALGTDNNSEKVLLLELNQ